MGETGARPPVVVADDESDVRRVLGRMIVALGYEVVLAADGTEALALCREHRPQLLLVDREMPPPRYLAIARQLRAELGDAAPRVVVVTGNVEVSAPDEVDGVLAKPFAMADIRLVLERFAG